MQIISNLVELEAKIAECNHALTYGSDDAMRRLFGTFQLDFSKDCPTDPFSEVYRDFQMEIYKTLTGSPYLIENEISGFATAEKARCPFPYYLRSASTAGHHLLAIGFMLCKLSIPSGGRIIEFGAGWGNSTLQLAQTGFDVTAVDIDPGFCDVMRARARQLDLPLTVIEGEFFLTERIERPYDAALFFECFHHCDDHMRLLRGLHQAIMPGGRVYLASEPIIPEYGIPWGVRVDGEALWAIRNFGWLELGFDEGYFLEAMALTGWHGTKHHCATVPWASVWELRRLDEMEPATAGLQSTPERPVDEALADNMNGPPDNLPPQPLDDAGHGRSSESVLHELEAVYRSTSWRLTRPLRSIGRLIGRR